jgi:Cu/Ag efflux protein CusF
MRKSLLVAAFVAIAAMPAQAQNNRIRMVGMIDKVDNTTLVVKSEDGKTETLKLSPKLMVFEAKPASLHDIKDNDFVASAAVKGPDGKLHSTELRIFPEAMRGLGEGQRPMHDARDQTMTNATVTGTVMVGGSNDIKVKLPNGESELVLDPGVPVTAIVPAEKSMVKQGAKVQVNGIKTAEGTVAERIIIQ